MKPKTGELDDDIDVGVAGGPAEAEKVPSGVQILSLPDLFSSTEFNRKSLDIIDFRSSGAACLGVVQMKFLVRLDLAMV